MYCRFCEAEIVENSSYCYRCGKATEINSEKQNDTIIAETNCKEIDSTPLLIKSRPEVVFANEIIINLKLVLLSLVVGFFLYFAFLLVYDINKFDNFDYSKVTITGGAGEGSVVMTGLPDDEFFDGESIPSDIEGVKDMVKRRKSRVIDASKTNSIYSFIILIPILIGGRYVIKASIWVNKTAD